LRRILVVVTALAMLVVAGTASAATTQINNYTGTKLSFKPNKAGSKKKPTALGYTEALTAAGVNGDRTAVLTDIKLKLYGIKETGKGFPTCSAAQITASPTFDASCPKGSMAATGSITAVLGAENDFTQPGSACDPLLHVYNAGQGKLTFFFVDTPTHVCLGGLLQTGSTPPWTATYKTQGKNLLVDIPVPSSISFPITGQAGSLETLNLNWIKQTKKINHKKVAEIASVACSHHSRPYSVTFNANLPVQTATLGVYAPGPANLDTISGAQHC
jgi:hypothetical protein